MEATARKPQQSDEKKRVNNSNRSNCLSQWWYQRYSHQKRLVSFLEHPLFHLLITVLVVGECGSVVAEIILVNVKSQHECTKNFHVSYFLRQYFDKKVNKLERGIQVCHYISLSILSLFILELLLKIYAFGYHYWNCKENHKLDYFDAFLVVFSFTVEVYFLTIHKESILAHSAMLIVILRLWHLLRIANAVARCLQKKETFKTVRRRRHAKVASGALLVPPSIQAMLDLMQEKTECLRRDISTEQSLVERFKKIDQKCQDAFDDYYGDETKLLKEIQKLHLVTKRTQIKKKYLIAV